MAEGALATYPTMDVEVPLSEMLGYITTLRTMTSGRGQFSTEFAHYMPCPQNIFIV